MTRYNRPVYVDSPIKQQKQKQIIKKVITMMKIKIVTEIKIKIKIITAKQNPNSLPKPKISRSIPEPLNLLYVPRFNKLVINNKKW